jgi:hypothetical protein
MDAEEQQQTQDHHQKSHEPSLAAPGFSGLRVSFFAERTQCRPAAHDLGSRHRVQASPFLEDTAFHNYPSVYFRLDFREFICLGNLPII